MVVLSIECINELIDRHLSLINDYIDVYMMDWLGVVTYGNYSISLTPFDFNYNIVKSNGNLNISGI